MTPNPPPTEASPQEHQKSQSGIANVFRSLGLRNRSSGYSIPSAAASASSDVSHSSPRLEYFGDIAPDDGYQLLEKLKKDKPLPDRVAAAEALRTIVVDFPAQFVTDVWHNAHDLADNDNPRDARQAALRLFGACLKNINEPSSLDRLRFYRTIAAHDHTDDFDDQLHAMMILTSGGRNLASFEKEIGGLLSKWLKTLFVEAGKARQQRKREGGSPDYITGPEYCLKELFKFVTAIIKFNFQAFEEHEINQILSDILTICRKTTHKRDIEGSIIFVETLVTYGYIPTVSLRPCIEVLCGTYATIRDLNDVTWNAISNLCRSHMAHKCILTFLDILRNAGKKTPQAPNTNTLRGAVWFLEKLIAENGKDGLPKAQLSVILPALREALAADSPRLELEIVRAIGQILVRPDIVSQISFDEWSVPLDILVRGSRRTTERHDGVLLKRLGVPDVPKASSKDKDINSAISQSLFQTINLLEEACRETEFAHVESVVEFFLQVFGHIPDSAAEFVINYYASEHLCYPSCDQWLENAKRLIDIFFRTRTRPSEMRIQILSMVKDVYETIREVCEEPLLYEIIQAALTDFQSETDAKVLDALMKIVVDVAADSNMGMFNFLIGIMTNYAHQGPHSVGKQSLSSVRSTTSYGSLVNIVTRGLAKLFMRNMDTDAAKSVRAYEEIVRIAGSAACETDARLTAMKLLFRLRADSENAVFLVENPECDYLGGVLNRSISAMDKEILSNLPSPKEDEASSSSRSNRSNSISQHTIPRLSNSRNTEKHEKYRRRPLWSYPGTRPLPQAPSENPSPVLLTFYDPQSDQPAREGPTLDPTTAIRVSLWMEQIIPIVQQGCDWEVYSFVLCHIPSQLANKTCFRNCKGHITMLRNYVCEQLHTNRIPSPDLPNEIKRADIAVSLIHLLTVLISYREHFAKTEKEGIVKAFQLGLHSWNRTAKPCIHALSICCYELPGSTSKYLSGILTKLSQIITSPVVSVHILEFLSALAKLPQLYSNFTEPDFRNIFGIAFRYIQHAKETAAQQSQRSSYHARAQSRETTENSGTDQPDLPQYVLTLAYNVLTTWFLSLRLVERPKYVSWIIRGLVLHDHSNQVDEQSEACIDMLQRFTFSERDPEPPQKLEPSPEINTKTWLHGNTIMTIQTAPDSGISSIAIRRPAGTSYFSIKQEARDLKSLLESKFITVDDRPEGTIDDYMSPNVLPSHLMLQLIGGTGIVEGPKPLPLIADDKTKRAIEVFDRIPVVDFHKIGVVYAGAGQTRESEILANAMGSPDYTEFISNLGDLIKLKGADMNTGGLDRENDIDGPFMYMWKDRTTQIAFHITTMMPNSEHDPQFTLKKRHIGNDFVNIVFNNSGLPWKFGTVPSQFNFVSILISPEARSSFVSSRMVRGGEDKTFYRVKLACKEGFSDISPAQEPKMVSAKNLPAFVRNLALNASIYSHVFNEGGAEHISNPRHRLRSIKQMRERVGAPAAPFHQPKSNSPLAPQSNNRRVSAISTQTASTDYSFRSLSTQMNGESDAYETEDLLASLDFSRYT